MSATARTCLALCLPALLALAAPAPAQTVSLNQGGQPRTIAVGDAASLPPGFPEDVFVPHGAQLVRVEQAGAGRLLLEFELADTPASLDGAYSTAMTASGWAQAAVVPLAGTRVQAWEKSARAVVVALTAEPGGTRLRLQLLPRKASAEPAPR